MVYKRIDVNPIFWIFCFLNLAQNVSSDTGINMIKRDIGDDLCAERYICDDNPNLSTEKECACDDMCHVYKDCCTNKVDDPVVSDPYILTLDIAKYGQCQQVDGYLNSVYVIDKCPVEFKANDIRKACEKVAADDDILLQVPVSESRFGIVFSNMYCAMCHGWSRDQVTFWGASLKCEMTREVRGSQLTTKEIMEKTTCKPEFAPSEGMTEPRSCQMVKKVCNPKWQDTETEMWCVNGDVAYAWPYRISLPYKNKHCALCNNVENYACRQMYTIKKIPEVKVVNSISILLDFNKGQTSVGTQVKTETTKCDEGHVYDIIKETCRPLLCGPGFALQGDLCVWSYDFEVNGTGIVSCAKVEVEEGAYLMFPDASIYVNASDIIFPLGEYIMVNSSVLVCAYNFSQTYTYSESVFNYDIAQGILSFVGQVISILSLSLLLFVYGTNTPLRTVPGKCLMCLAFTLCLAQFLFIIGGFAHNLGGFCYALAIFTHFFFLSSFFWMNTMAFDVWRTFHTQFTRLSGSDRLKKFTAYCLYAFFVPAFIVLLSIIFDNVALNNVPKPHYGDGFCWINNKKALLYLFALPLFILLGINIVFFVMAVYNIYKVAQGTKILRKKKSGAKKKRVILYIKLSSIMGLTWTFGFLASFTGSTVLWYFFIIFNTLQGLFICVAFICNRKVIRMMGRYSGRVSSAMSNFTQSTRLSTRFSKRSMSDDNVRKSAAGHIKEDGTRAHLTDRGTSDINSDTTQSTDYVPLYTNPTSTLYRDSDI